MTEIEWLLSGDTGIGSRCILATMTGSTIANKHFAGQPPRDLDDFGQCVRLLQHFPQWQARLPEMAQCPLWVGVVRRWDELYRDYMQLSTEDWRPSARYLSIRSHIAERFERVMHEALDEGALAAGYEEIGPHGPYTWIKKDSPDSKGVA